MKIHCFEETIHYFEETIHYFEQTINHLLSQVLVKVMHPTLKRQSLPA